MSETQPAKEINKSGQTKAPRKPADQFGYMYIGHIPHGFYEEEIKSYFSQFGRVCRVRLARSKHTGNYKGYGFVQFENKQVADIAAETMNNYLMFNRLLKCHSIPHEKLHPETFKDAKKKFFKPIKSMFRKKFNQKKSADKLIKISLRRSLKMKKRQEKLKALGINLDLNQVLNPKAEEKKNKKESLKKDEKKEVPKKEKINPQEKKKSLKKETKKDQDTKSEPIKRKKDIKEQEKSLPKPKKQIPIEEKKTLKKKNKK
ncbi:MKI67 FHA domain-interacting nucleolar phospho [Brachionus plicatilis]|uniref:MKI67 FHA domain-interacting nucleolar phospho n=1 Tax=Brachionus plicatilis TaxID=10195 RepID=A0A3M7P8V2_BRAPC|nr:MKI67 FHA domain-interacting nucleolar phospho [Brachionus plicatilis]